VLIVTSSARVSAKGVATLALLAIAGFAAAAAASAHVTVSATGATSGGSDQVITFRVPSESATASTTGLSVQLPTDTPIASVLVAPHSGWTDKVTTMKLTKPIKTDDGDITEAVSAIVWTANNKSDGIRPGQFDQFSIIAGQLPNASSLTFRAIQTYSDASSVAWIETAAPGSTAAPEHPAPVLSLAPAAPGGSGAGTAAASQPTVAAAGQAATGASKGAATTGIILGIVGILLGGAALVVALVRRRSDLAHD
jgi:periplasmic copper chaperone A